MRLQARHFDADGQCALHGQFRRTYHGSTCPRCADEEAEAVRQRQQRVALAIARSGLEGRYLDATFDNYKATTDKQRMVLAECRQFAESLDSGSGGLWLTGTVGTGKTHLGAAMVRYSIEVKFMRAVITSARKLIAGRRALWDASVRERIRSENSGYMTDRQPETETEYIDRLASVALLVVDEIGADQTTDADRASLYDVLDRRYALLRPTVLISNLTPKQVAEVLDERLFDRMQEGAKYLALNWPSYRRKGAALQSATDRPETTEGAEKGAA